MVLKKRVCMYKQMGKILRNVAADNSWTNFANRGRNEVNARVVAVLADRTLFFMH